jgi:hypothetical protein
MRERHNHRESFGSPEASQDHEERAEEGGQGGVQFRFRQSG